MGQEVRSERFERRDFERFTQRLREETEWLHGLVERRALSEHAPVAGLELEAWLVDAHGRPAPRNDEFLDALRCEQVVTELGRFNIELNVPPRAPGGDGLARLGDDLAAMWERCRRAAARLGMQPVAIGILPSLAENDLTLPNLSDRARYRALNEQTLRQRQGRPVQLHIEGPDGSSQGLEQHDVMLEAATTSFQIHLQVPAARVLRTYNAALLASAPLVAVTANSPLLFGQPLWQETRIPLFEQALGVCAREDGHHEPMGRVSFGSGYAGWSLVEAFRENLERFEPLLPLDLDEPAHRLAHLRLHNGTIWRWNRPIVGFDDDGRVHLRVEHRPMAAAPSLADTAADMAFAIGLIAGLAALPDPPERELPFETARANFYAAARDGLEARLTWPGKGPVQAARCVLSLLPLASDGLSSLAVRPADVARWLAIIEARASRGRTGAHWQLRALDALGSDLGRMTLAYAKRQAENVPVHRWSLP